MTPQRKRLYLAMAACDAADSRDLDGIESRAAWREMYHAVAAFNAHQRRIRHLASQRHRARRVHA